MRFKPQGSNVYPHCPVAARVSLPWSRLLVLAPHQHEPLGIVEQHRLLDDKREGQREDARGCRTGRAALTAGSIFDVTGVAVEMRPKGVVVQVNR